MSAINVIMVGLELRPDQASKGSCPVTMGPLATAPFSQPRIAAMIVALWLRHSLYVMLFSKVFCTLTARFSLFDVVFSSGITVHDNWSFLRRNVCLLCRRQHINNHHCHDKAG